VTKAELEFVSVVVQSGRDVQIDGLGIRVSRGEESLTYKRSLIRAMKPAEAVALANATSAIL
jgi:hypothetical protein